MKLLTFLQLAPSCENHCSFTLSAFGIEGLRDLYFSLSIIRIIKSRKMRWAEHVVRMGEKRNAYRLLVGKLEGKRPLGRPSRRRVDNIRMNLGEVGWCDVDWIGLAQDRNRWRALVNSVLDLRVL
jgi:hypothetical protein